MARSSSSGRGWIRRLTPGQLGLLLAFRAAPAAAQPPPEPAPAVTPAGSVPADPVPADPVPSDPAPVDSALAETREPAAPVAAAPVSAAREKPAEAPEKGAEVRHGELSFGLEARVISGFEVERSRPSGAQTQPAQSEYGFRLKQARLGFTAERSLLRANLSLELSDALSAQNGGGYDSPPYLRTATLELRFSRALRLTVGRYKRPFSRVELISEEDLPVLRRGLLNGLLVEDNQWGDRAVGAMASGRLELAKLRWYVSLTNPHWASALPSQGLDVLGRVQLSPAKGVSVGVNGGYKYLRLGSQADYTHNAGVGADLSWKLGPLELLLEGSFADLPLESGRPRGFGALLLANLELPLGPDWSLQPVLFAEVADANSRFSQTESARLAFGLNLLAFEAFRLMPQLALVRSLGDTSQQNPWRESEQYSLVFSLAL